MSSYFIVATTRYPLKLRGKEYKIGDYIPTTITEKEYNFFKDALIIEECKIVDDVGIPKQTSKSKNEKFEETQKSEDEDLFEDEPVENEEKETSSQSKPKIAGRKPIVRK